MKEESLLLLSDLQKLINQVVLIDYTIIILGDVNMIDLIIGFVIAGVLFVVEYFLCVKLKNPLWGGIIPMLILIGTIWIFASGKVPLTIRNVFPFVIANTIFFGDWGTGREKYKKLQQAEMDKMKARDIN